MMSLAHALVAAEAKSCLAALADTAPTFDASVAYEHALLYLHAVHSEYGLGIDFPRETDRRRLRCRAEVAIEALAKHGVDGLSVELLLAMLDGAHDLEVGGGPESAPPG